MTIRNHKPPRVSRHVPKGHDCVLCQRTRADTIQQSNGRVCQQCLEVLGQTTFGFTVSKASNREHVLRELSGMFHA